MLLFRHAGHEGAGPQRRGADGGGGRDHQALAARRRALVALLAYLWDHQPYKPQPGSGPALLPPGHQPRWGVSLRHSPQLAWTRNGKPERNSRRSADSSFTLSLVLSVSLLVSVSHYHSHLTRHFVTLFINLSPLSVVHSIFASFSLLYLSFTLSFRLFSSVSVSVSVPVSFTSLLIPSSSLFISHGHDRRTSPSSGIMPCCKVTSATTKASWCVTLSWVGAVCL